MKFILLIKPSKYCVPIGGKIEKSFDDSVFVSVSSTSGIKGELSNISDEVQMVPKLVIGLRDDNTSNPSFRTSWTHRLNYKKLLPNQKIIFETDLKSVPYSNLICDIKLNTL